MHSYAKRQKVFFTPWGQSLTIRASVETVHRDGTLTVRALFHHADGADVPGYLGFTYRLGPETLRTTASAA